MPYKHLLGFLYPGYAAEDDYLFAAALLGDGIEFEVVHTTIGEDAHREDALRDTGSLERLLEGVGRLDRAGLASVMWACTSGSFVFGLEGARNQAVALAEAAGVPGSSTSLAFLDALETLGIRRVAVAATYPADIAACFSAFLAAGGIETVAANALGIITGVEVGEVGVDAVQRLVAVGDAPGAEAVLLPDTALHTVAHLRRLEAAAGKPVLTANQVTIWKALRLAGVDVPACPALGSLFVCEAVAR